MTPWGTTGVWLRGEIKAETGGTAAVKGISITWAKAVAPQSLDDAKRLRREGNYEAALAKHVWYHENALSVNSSHYGVRLSFALSDWIELGKEYPKATKKLKSIRDVKTKRLAAGAADRELFHDVSSINDHLDEHQATVELFKGIDTANPAFAAKVYDLADEALLQGKEYALAKKYLGDATKRLESAREDFDRQN